MMGILVKRVIPAVVVLLAGIFIFLGLKASKPTPQVAPKKRQGTLVTVMEAKLEPQDIRVEAMGTVIPARKLEVIPEVGGRIVEMNDNLIPGGFIKAGEVIAHIDPRDYEAAIKQAEANLEAARLNLELEHGRQVVAKREWEVINPTTQSSETSSYLALRKPQLESAEANVESARSALEQASLNLSRTIITAPFNATVENESVEIGLLVSQQSRIATLVGSDRYWIQVSVPVSQLPLVALPDEEGQGGAQARVIHDLGSGAVIEKEGQIVRLLSDLDPNGRMARLLVEVKAPLGLDSDNGQSLPLLIGAYVKVEIVGPEIENVCAIPRTAIREGNRVWVMNEEDCLSVREVEIIWRRKEEVLVKNRIRPGEQIVTSRIPAPIPGMLLRTNGIELETEGAEKLEARNANIDSEIAEVQ